MWLRSLEKSAKWQTYRETDRADRTIRAHRLKDTGRKEDGQTDRRAGHNAATPHNSRRKATLPRDNEKSANPCNRMHVRDGVSSRSRITLSSHFALLLAPCIKRGAASWDSHCLSETLIMTWKCIQSGTTTIATLCISVFVTQYCCRVYLACARAHACDNIFPHVCDCVPIHPRIIIQSRMCVTVWEYIHACVCTHVQHVLANVSEALSFLPQCVCVGVCVRMCVCVLHVCTSTCTCAPWMWMTVGECAYTLEPVWKSVCINITWHCGLNLTHFCGFNSIDGLNNIFSDCQTNYCQRQSVSNSISCRVQFFF